MTKKMDNSSSRTIREMPHWPDARGWIGIGSFVLTVMVLWMVKEDDALRRDEFFKVLATLIVGGFIKDVLGWAYQATKTGGDLADQNAALVTRQMESTSKIQPVQVLNPPSQPVPITDNANPTPKPEDAMPGGGLGEGDPDPDVLPEGERI